MNHAEFPVVIYHNPACGTSRNTIAMVEAAGYQPTIVPYLKTGWTAELLRDLMAKAGATPRDFLREKGTPAAELGLLAADIGDEAIIDAMVRHPILVNRPIVSTPKGTALCRPSESVLPLLDRVPDSFIKEDGQVVRPA